MVSSGLSRGEAAALQQHGQRLYQQGNFKAAVEAFTEALKVKDVDAVGVLDVRAATYTKLSQYDQALRDARHMIKKDKHDERGYLRCAKALLLDGKPSKALEVYAYGLKTLPSNHPRRKLVQQLHDKLQDKMTEKCLDPFTVLPLEMAVMVLQHFDFKQIVGILRVSRKWEQFLTSMRNLWMHVDLSGGRGKMNWTSVRAYIRRSKGMLTHATIKNLATPSVQKSLELLSRCPKLEYLEVWCPFNHNAFYDLFKCSRQLKTLVVSAHITMPQEHITKFLAGLPLLERVEFHSVKASPPPSVNWPMKLPNLKVVTLGSQEQTPSAHFTPALDIPGLLHPSDPHSLPNLEELKLDWDPPVLQHYPLKMDPVGCTRLRRLNLSGVRFDGNFGLPSSLESILIRRGTGVGEFPFSIDRPIELPNLKTLALSDIPWVTIGTLQVFFVELEVPIRVLHIDSCFNIRGTQLEMLTGSSNFNALVELNVSHISALDDRMIARLTSKMSDLKVLNLSYTAITGCTVKMLADARSSEDKIAKVDRIFAKGCEELSSDAVSYARAKGIEIFT